MPYYLLIFSRFYITNVAKIIIKNIIKINIVDNIKNIIKYINKIDVKNIIYEKKFLHNIAITVIINN